MHRNWFWGVFLVLAAGILVTSQLGILTYHIGFWTLLVAMFLVAALVESLIHFAVAGTVFSLAFLAIIFAKPLGITALAPWTILGAALLLTAGLSMIIKPRWRWRRQVRFAEKSWHHGDNHHWQEEDIASLTEDDAVVNVNMSSSIRYLQSTNFQRAAIRVNMGNAKVYLDNVALSEDGATILVDASFGGIELYLPRTWNIETDVDTNFGAVGEKGVQETGDGPVVRIQGSVSFGSVSLIYV